MSSVELLVGEQLAGMPPAGGLDFPDDNVHVAGVLSRHVLKRPGELLGNLGLLLVGELAHGFEFDDWHTTISGSDIQALLQHLEQPEAVHGQPCGHQEEQDGQQPGHQAIASAVQQLSGPRCHPCYDQLGADEAAVEGN